MFVWGGANDRGSDDNNLYKFNFVQRKWKKVSTKGTAPVGMWGHSAVVHGDVMYVYGGLAGSTFSNTMYTYLFKSNRWEAPAVQGQVPSARHLHSAVVHDGKVWIWGGFASSNFNDLSTFDCKTNQWEGIGDGSGSAPQARRGHRAIVLGDQMVIMGGRGKAGPLADMHTFDFATNEWQKAETRQVNGPTARTFHSVGEWEGVWVFGGLGLATTSDSKSTNLADLYYYNPKGIIVQLERSLDSGKPHDFVHIVPWEVSLQVMSYLDERARGACSVVSKAWNRLSEDDVLWGSLVSEQDRKTFSELSMKQIRRKRCEDPYRETDARRLLYDDGTRGIWLNPKNLPVIRSVMIGEGGVGKSAMTVQFIMSQWMDEYDPTIEDSYRMAMVIGKVECIIDILDTAGPEEFSAMRDHYIRNGECFVLTFDITKRASFDEIESFHRQLLRVKNVSSAGPESGIIVVLVGNKSDLEQQRQVSTEEAQDLAHSWGIHYIECSAKTNHNIAKIYFGISRQWLQMQGETQEPGSPPPQRCLLA
eukprot:TRINITY_DN654_c0_g1_i11.p1 TRINITY_DN654_c0_g1~~TRINITY_DN654_c0_g1_i11.p1  ORF type:complete len:533 (+),score=69.97 TRINITY_DN654_c0_g1_i11:253-1851(+)